MADDLEKKQQEAEKIQTELNEKGLSRRGLLQRLQVLGVGFGAAYLLSVNRADAAIGDESSSAAASLKSTNPALNDIIEDGRQNPLEGDDSESDPESSWIKTAYRRHYVRNYFRGGYRRHYNRRYGRAGGYRRFYRRGGGYRRFYRRYARGFRRFYRRFG